MNRLLLSTTLLALPWILGSSDTFPWVEVPDGAVAKAWASVGENTIPAKFGDDFPLANLGSGKAWDKAETWLEWSEWLVGEVEGDATEAAAARRAGLACLALEQGRNEDAWRHFSACKEAPEWLALLMPRFLPGLSAEHAPGLAGRPGVLPDAVLFRPCIPSLPPNDSGVLLAREATIRDLRVHEARFDMKVTFDSYGVQLDFEWKSGGSGALLVLIPEPDDYFIRVEYVDWIRQDVKREPHLVELSELTPQVSLFARIRGRQDRWPGFSGGEAPRELSRAGLWLEHEPLETELDYLKAVAEAATRVLGSPVSVRARASERGEAEETEAVGTILRVPAPGPDRSRKLAWFASTLERYVLDAPQTGK